jgi:hypothetical protein
MRGEALGQKEYQELRRGILVTGSVMLLRNTFLAARFVYLVHTA